MIDDLNPSPLRGILRPVLTLTGCVFVVALLLLPFTWGRTGLNGPAGLGVAAGICLVSGWVAEGLACALHRYIAPLGVMLLGMTVRVLPPLGVCLALAAQRADGRPYLPFIGYLLTLYLVTLAVETWLGTQRASRDSHPFNQNAH